MILWRLIEIVHIGWTLNIGSQGFSSRWLLGCDMWVCRLPIGYIETEILLVPTGTVQYTFILTASKDLPKQCTTAGGNAAMSCAFRKSVGVRMPDDIICAALLSKLDEPLLCTRWILKNQYRLSLPWNARLFIWRCDNLYKRPTSIDFIGLWQWIDF